MSSIVACPNILIILLILRSLSSIIFNNGLFGETMKDFIHILDMAYINEKIVVFTKDILNLVIVLHAHGDFIAACYISL